jgi:hypothetical protein
MDRFVLFFWIGSTARRGPATSFANLIASKQARSSTWGGTGCWSEAVALATLTAGVVYDPAQRAMLDTVNSSRNRVSCQMWLQNKGGAWVAREAT